MLIPHLIRLSKFLLLGWGRKLLFPPIADSSDENVVCLRIIVFEALFVNLMCGQV